MVQISEFWPYLSSSVVFWDNTERKTKKISDNLSAGVRTARETNIFVKFWNILNSW